MATRFYLHPFRTKADLLSNGYATVQDAATAAQSLLLTGDVEVGTKVAIVQLVAMIDIPNPNVVQTQAANIS